MTNEDLSDSNQPSGGALGAGREGHHGWKSTWVESTAPSADDPRLAGPRLNPPELDEVPAEGGGGKETTVTDN